MALPIQTIQDFRLGTELSSHEPAQLRRTIEAQEARIAEQDILIDRQVGKIMELEQKLEDYQSIKTKTSPSDNNNFQLLAQIGDLKKENTRLETAHEGLMEQFQSLYHAQKRLLEEGLETFQKLPATSENKALFARINKQMNATDRARQCGKIMPLTALITLSDMQIELAAFLAARPLLTFQRSERYRAEILVEELMRDPKRKGLKTVDAVSILSHAEEKKIHTAQAIRAMKRAAMYHADKVVFETTPRVKARLCKIDINGGES